MVLAGVLLAGAWLGWGAGTARAQALSDETFAPGFGIVYGEGRTENGAKTQRLGFSSRRLQENTRIGSLTLVGEEHFDGIPFALLDPTLSRDDVELRYQSLFMEMKRYFPLGGAFHLYWGLRGGVSRIRGRIRDPAGGPAREFEADLVGPLALLAVPLALENPGFLLLALADGTSAGLTADLVPNRIWLDYQLSATLIPNHRDARIAIEERTLVTQTLQLLIVF